LERIVDYAVNLKYDDLPEDVIARAKLLLLDMVGCCLGGSASRLGKTVIEAIKDFAGSGKSTIIGDGAKVSCVLAGQINAITSDALDYNDVVSGLGHPGATVIPAALAVAEQTGASGEEVLASIVAGYETSIRIGFTTRPSTVMGKPGSFQYWHAFGAATSASKLLGLDLDQTLTAFGYAGASAPLAKRKKPNRPLSFTKDNFGEITAAGILGAYYARHGFISPNEPEFDFWVSDLEHLSTLTHGLGEEYYIMWVSFKPWSACRFMHSSLDVLAELIEKHSLKPVDIEKINVHTISPLATRLLLPPDVDGRRGYKPGNMVDAEFDIRYCMSMVILGCEPGLSWFTDEMLQSDEVLDIASKINVKTSFRADVLLNKFPYRDRRSLTEIEVRTKKGEIFKGEEEFIRGSPEKPLLREELISKFLSLTRQIDVNKDKANRIIKLVDEVESLSDISSIMDILYP